MYLFAFCSAFTFWDVCILQCFYFSLYLACHMYALYENVCQSHTNFTVVTDLEDFFLIRLFVRVMGRMLTIVSFCNCSRLGLEVLYSFYSNIYARKAYKVLRNFELMHDIYLFILLL